MVLMILAAACSSPPSPPTPSTPTPTPTPPAPLSIPVDLDGRIYALDCLGAAAAAPTVVLVGGLGVPATSWLPVQAALAEDVRTCAVDRPSVYAVPPGEERRTVSTWVRELHAVLDAAGVRAPIVLVGHSLGGLAVDLYAREHPSDVAALVFLDAIQPTFDARLEPMLVPSAASARRRDLALNEEGVVFEDILASEDEVARAGPLPDVPAVILVHGDPFADESAAWPSARVEALWLDLQDRLAAQLPGSRLIVADGSGHRIQHDRPDLVADAVRWVLESSSSP